MNVKLIGTGCGDLGTLTRDGAEALKNAGLIIGARRLLETIPEDWGGDRLAAIAPAEILANILQARSIPKWKNICVAYSGDTGFYSGARTLLPHLRGAGIDAEIIPGVSSVQMLAARLQIPWQDWALVSAHGLDCDAASACDPASPTFFLTGGKLGPADLCRQLTDGGRGSAKVIVAERLSYDDERITEGRAAELSEREWDPLSVMLVMPEPNAPEGQVLRPGIADERFIRGDVPMTKRDIRAVIAGRMQVQRTDVVWDVGAGTGSVSVELALQADRGQVWAVEREPKGCLLIEENRVAFGRDNLRVVEGSAPEALTDLPAPDRVFIGGSGGRMEDIVDLVLEKNPDALICVTAILLETVTEAAAAMTARGLEVSLAQINVSTARKAGEKHMMIGNNPIFVITGQKEASD